MYMQEESIASESVSGSESDSGTPRQPNSMEYYCYTDLSQFHLKDKELDTDYFQLDARDCAENGGRVYSLKFKPSSIDFCEEEQKESRQKKDEATIKVEEKQPCADGLGPFVSCDDIEDAMEEKFKMS